jgi:Flp pilus assembly pilin Flp
MKKKLPLFVHKKLKDFKNDEKGIAAIEFAGIAPFLLILIFGISEFSDGYAAKKQSNKANAITGDLFGQYAEVDTKIANGIFKIASESLNPFPGGDGFSAKVYMVSYDGTGNREVAWSWKKGGSCQAKDAAGLPTIPAAIAKPNTSWIISTSTYNFKPLFSSFFIGDVTFEEISVNPTRAAGVIKGC